MRKYAIKLNVISTLYYNIHGKFFALGLISTKLLEACEIYTMVLEPKGKFWELKGKFWETKSKILVYLNQFYFFKF